MGLGNYLRQSVRDREVTSLFRRFLAGAAVWMVVTFPGSGAMDEQVSGVGCVSSAVDTVWFRARDAHRRNSPCDGEEAESLRQSLRNSEVCG